MKRAILIAFIFVQLMGIRETAFGVERSDFRLKAPVKCNMTPGVPLRLALAREVIAETSPGFGDLRLFDNLGEELPYVIYKQRRPKRETRFFAWDVISYNNLDNAQTIVLKRPEKAANALDLRLITTARDFNKHVEVRASDDLRAWNLIATGPFFDFSSHIDLRRTLIEFPETDALYLQVILEDKDKPTSDGENIRLEYKDLKFSLSGQKCGEINIDRFTSRTTRKTPQEYHFDVMVISASKTSTDRDGNTVIDIGYLNLPVASVSLRVKTRYYYRAVEFWVAATGEDKSYQCIDRDIIYRIPDIDEVKNTFSVNTGRCGRISLKIINHDNPALEVEEIRIQWIRRNLYFIPEDEDSCAIYLGGSDIRPPQYELQRLIPEKYEKLMSYAECSIGPIEKNTGYSPGAGKRLGAKIEKFLFHILVVLLVCVLGFWIYRLARNVPVNRGS
ncbi:MAG: DUF3999 family protein [Thermodesulfobacteriota bacterium]|nr:DUF3999 family protein [Thermodesulfobacteriota bacterium]